jgi:hypothetical protein
MYDENEHRARTGAPYHSVTYAKWKFGEGVAHIYDENEHRAQRTTP